MITQGDEKLPVNTEHYFGACPKCGGADGYMNVWRSHWFVCDTHKTKWCAGANIFSSWMEGSQQDWECNAKSLGNYEEVDPLPIVPDDEEMHNY